MKNFEQIKGDASFRKFFRKRYNSFTSVIVFSKKDKFKNLLVYDSINKILCKNNILAPRLYQEYYNKNYLEIQDFGNDTILQILQKKKKRKLFYFKKIVQVLGKIQKIKDRKIKNFKKISFEIPKYDSKILIKEANLFCEWYVKKKLSNTKKNEFTKKFRKIVISLTSNLRLKSDVFVHRDFHVSNLMLVKNKIGVIDTQDALIGNQAYDLASLIDDVRFKTSVSFKNKIYQLYISKQKKINKHNFKNDFQILSVLRNLKIIGIFTRLALRDRKKNYLRLIPYTWQLINMRIDQNQTFIDLKNLLSQNFKKIK